jgi:hypothetical protein
MNLATQVSTLDCGIAIAIDVVCGKVRANAVTLLPSFHVGSYRYDLASHVGAGNEVLRSA